MKTVAYCGSFDPITLGHIDIIIKAHSIFKKIVIGVGCNDGKTHKFTLDDRLNMIQQSLKYYGLDNVECVRYDCDLVSFLNNNDIDVLIRGLRNVTDFNYEINLQDTLSSMDKSIQTVNIIGKNSLRHISSSLVRDCMKYPNIELYNMVPPPVDKLLGMTIC